MALYDKTGKFIEEQPSKGGLYGVSTTPTKQPEQPKESVIGGFVKGAGKGVLSTLTGAAGLGERIVRGTTKALLPKGIEEKIGISAPLEKTAAEKLVPEELRTPTTTAQKVGFGAEQIAEFFIPSSAVMKATTALKATKPLTQLAKGGRIAKLTETAITRGAPEAISAAGVTAVQTGGDLGETTRNGIIAGTIPIVGKGLSILKELKPVGFTRELATGVPKETFQRIKQMPEVYDDAMKHISENPAQPFSGLVQSIGNKLNELKTNAKNAFDEAVNFTKTRFPETQFNLENKIPELNKTLNQFNLSVSQMRDKAGRLISTGIVKPTTRTSPYTPQEISQISELVRKMRIKDMSVDELLDFSESVKNFFGDAVQRDNKKMIKLGAALLEDSTKFIDEVFPQLKNANNQYRAYYKALEHYGDKIVDNTGALKDTAEQFLSNIANLNKGEQREAIKILERITGIPIVDNVIILKDAQKLNHLFPQTGSRTLDILRSLAIRGATVGGAVIGGIGGAAAGGATTLLASPKLAGKTAIKTATLAEKLRSKTPTIVKETIKRALPGKD